MSNGHVEKEIWQMYLDEMGFLVDPHDNDAYISWMAYKIKELMSPTYETPDHPFKRTYPNDQASDLRRICDGEEFITVCEKNKLSEGQCGIGFNPPKENANYGMDVKLVNGQIRVSITE